MVGHKITWIFFLEISVRAVLFHGINCYRQKRLIFFHFLTQIFGAQFPMAILEIGPNPEYKPSFGSLDQRFTASREARIRPVLVSLKMASGGRLRVSGQVVKC